MTIKKYFENNSFSNNSLTDLESKEGTDFESFEYLDELEEQRTRFIPNVDFSKPENFARYGLAEQYYKDAIARIINNYPYDGSKKELVEWYNDSTYFDLYVFENEYPRSNGYGIFAANGWGSQVSFTDGYGTPSTSEYIFVKGGPNPGPSGSYVGGNIYDPTEQRNSNLALNLGTRGATVEFWLKKDEFIPSLTEREVIFDLWNNELSSSDSYGRFRLELNTSSAGNFASSKAFRAILHSGSVREEVLLGNYTTTASFTSQGWTHFAFAASNTAIKLYKNGELDSTVSFGSAFNNVSGTLNAYVGALIAAPSGSSASAGAGRLSGSIDEFRYWKTTRSEREIERNWFTNVYGGTNTDDANTDLGVYFKFNEGITGNSTTDAVVLDYSGRISNGAWTGYTSASRNTGSAIVLASAAEKEFKDPILRTNNALYTTYYDSSLEKGKRHDLNNSSNLYYSYPDWIIDEDLESGEKFLQLAQAVASYFDTAQLQIDALRKLKDNEYTTQTQDLSDKPISFAKSLLTERGIFVPDLFVERNTLEDLTQKTDGLELESDLFDLKNLIYQNIYNNITDITKKKGTKSAIRNVLHTFGVGDELVSVKTYADKEKIVLEDEKTISSQRIKLLDFAKPNYRDGSAYQTGSSSSNELAYIPASTDKTRLCVETFINFPNIDETTPKELIPNVSTLGLFGFHDIETTTPPYNTWESPSQASAFVRARKGGTDENSYYFELSSSVSGVSTLTSSVVNNLFNDSNWYFSVQMEPQNEILFASSSLPDYNIVFRGYSFVGETLNESFVVSSSVARATALSFLQTNQKVYVGAERANFVGALVHSTNTKNAGLRFWLRNLTEAEQISHAKDFLNYGSETNNNNSYSFDDETRTTDLAPTDYLALNWSYETLTGTDASGLMDILDSTSGSAERRSRGSYVNTIAGYHYPGATYELPVSSTGAIDISFLNSYSPAEFDGYVSDNLIQIKDREKQTFTINNRFVSYVTAVEKSAQAGLNAEMLKMFGSIKELASFFSKPVDKYRKEYKELRFLRERFFNNVANDVDTEDFLEFYKWIDSAMQAFVGQLIPTTANHNKDVFNVVESHVLERNKYQNKFPTLELRRPDSIAGIEAGNKLGIDWRYNHAPIPLNQNENYQWWHTRTERSNPALTSGDAATDASRQAIQNVLNATRTRSYTAPQKFKVNDLYIGKDTREGTYWDAAIQEFGSITDIDGPGPLTASVSVDYLLVHDYDVYDLEDYTDVINLNKKVKRSFKIQNSREYNESYSYGKGHLLAPFTLWSSSIDTGYQSELGTNFKSNIGLNNHHDDVYSRFRNASLQSPFTEGWVGGRQYRHIALNAGSDAQGTRPEGFYLLAGADFAGTASLGVVKTTYTTDGAHDFDTPRAALYREELAKRPLNIKNRQYSTASSRLGNFKETYEVVMTNGRTKNNLWFHDNSSQVLTETEVWNLNRGTASPYLNATLPTRGVVKSVIVNRFSAPGGPEIQSRGYLEPTGEELSPYNAYPFRNTSVIYSSGSGNNDFTGSTGPRVNISTNIHTQNDGLRVLLSRRSGQYGIDSVYGTVRSLDYDTTPSYQKINRNALSQSTGINYNNFFVSNQVPRTPANYSWVRSALTGASGSFSYSRNATIPSGSTSQAIPFAELITLNEQNPGLNRSYTGLYTGSSIIAAQITASLYSSMVDQGSTEIANTLTAPNVRLENFHTYAHAINNSLFGHNSFRQIRGGESRQARSLRENNTLSFRYGKQYSAPDRPGSDWLVQNISFAPALINYQTLHNIRSSGRYIKLSYTFNNELDYLPLDNRALNAITDTRKLRNSKKTNYNYISNLYLSDAPVAELASITYKQQIWPKAENTFRKINRQRTQFTIDWWSSGRASRDRNDVYNSQNNLISSQSIWVIDGVSDTTGQPKDLFSPYQQNTDAYQYKSIFSAGELQNNCMINYTIVGSPNATVLANGFGDNEFAKKIYMEAKIKPSVLYARDNTIFTASLVFSESVGSVQIFVPTQTVGGVPWSAPEEAGKEPFYYKDYEHYILDQKTSAKDYSIIPEFRISPVIDQILDSTSGEDTVLEPTFDLTGAFYPDDSDDSFFTEFTNSDLIKYFSIIKNKEDVNKGKIKLTCKAAKKFLPYEGFYPAQRVAQLGTLFSQSYAPVVTLSGDGHPVNPGGVNSGGSFRTALMPFLAPGILCNSIKSGVAIEYPVFTASFDPILNVTGTYLSSSDGSSRYDEYGARISTNFNGRLPFEAVLDPLGAYGLSTFVDAEPNENAILLSTASFPVGTSGDNRYKRAVNNFVAETMNLFLINQSVSALVSGPQTAPGGFSFVPGREYNMDIRIFEEGMSMYDGNRSFGPPTTHLGNLDNDFSFLPYLPPYDVKESGNEESMRITFKAESSTHDLDYIIQHLTKSFTLDTVYSTSTAVLNRNKLDGTIQLNRKLEVESFDSGEPRFAWVIQPKWETPILDFSHRTASIDVKNVKAVHDITVNSNPSAGETFFITDGFSEFTYTFTLGAPGAFEIQIGVDATATATNIRNQIPVNNSTIENNFVVGGSGTNVTLTAKACGELPNFTSNDGTGGDLTIISTNGSGFYNCSTVADNYYVGMWHQYGRIPTGSQGIKMQIKNVPTDDTINTGSLADALALPTTPVKLGVINNTTVKEAIVAIPYRPREFDGKPGFFPIDKGGIVEVNEFLDGTRDTLSPSLPGEYYNLVNAMRKYVFPPRFDFVNRDKVEPFAMFVFEFNMRLDQQDLADIWQNLPPTSTSGKTQINSRFEYEDSSFEITYGLGSSWFGEEGLPADARWLVFKVKQRAAYDYYEQARKSSLALGYNKELEKFGEVETTTPLYSYNWPYDFFSFVELAKINTEISIDDNTTKIPTPVVPGVDTTIETLPEAATEGPVADAERLGALLRRLTGE